MNKKFFISIFSALAIIAVIIGFLQLIQTIKLLSNHIETNGSIIGMVQDCHSKGCHYDPKILFYTQKNDSISFIPNSYAIWSHYSVGQNISIIYSPDDPKNVRINSFTQLYFVSIGPWLIALLFGSAIYLVLK